VIGASIREMSRQAQVSINTVKVAYSHLEDRCLIEVDHSRVLCLSKTVGFAQEGDKPKKA
jgi:DNA-binding transcriptional regulator YhcF (GntR family)